MLRVLSSDFLKIRHTAIWFLICLGPIGVISMQAANFTLRYDYLMHEYAADLWGGLILNVSSLMVPALLMGLTIIASMIANIEHQTNAWKQVIALPVTKLTVISSKFGVTVLLLLVSSTLVAIGTLVLGLALGMQASDIPYRQLLTMNYYPYLAAMPFIALQVWLSITIKNQAIPLTIGIVGLVISLFAMVLADWVPWKWPYLQNEWNEPMYSVAAGLALGMLLYIIGLLSFVRRDVT
ncbi:ABC-2 family transporter protein [compost metagenome]